MKTEKEDKVENEEEGLVFEEEKKAVKKEKVTKKRGRDGWEVVYQKIQEYRETHRNAPVDSMGCGALSDSDREPHVRRFQTLVSLMLSSQTKDEVC